jgi:hypothetical protein
MDPYLAMFKLSLLIPILIIHHRPSITTMVNLDAQFDAAVAMVRNLPPDGPVDPTQTEQLEVTTSSWATLANDPSSMRSSNRRQRAMRQVLHRVSSKCFEQTNS